MAQNVLRKEWMVKPSECDANRQLPLTMLVAQMIDLATDHANILGIGFLNLEPKGLGWVLSRLSVEMKRWPGNGEKYTLSTWIETYNSHFSERCFSVVSDSGETIGYARTIWMIIDLKSHNSVGTANTVMPPEMLPGIDCPIGRMMRQKKMENYNEAEYRFKYCDLDFYRHVNTVRYISILLNQFTLEEFDARRLVRFDIAFSHEAKYGETAVIRSAGAEGIEKRLWATEDGYLRRNFEMAVGDQPILTSSICLA